MFNIDKPWPPAVDIPECRENYDEIWVAFLLLVVINEIFDNMFPLGMRPAENTVVAFRVAKMRVQPAEIIAATEKVECCLDILSSCALKFSHLELERFSGAIPNTKFQDPDTLNQTSW